MNAAPFLLAIDSGNSAIKWGLYDGCQWLVKGTISQSERITLTTAWAELPAPASVIISNVAGAQVAEDLATLVARWRIQPEWIAARASQCGVRNCYNNPGQLGCDRWAALIAAWHMLQQKCLVVDVGTAMTIDALTAAGEFRGGIIVPGPGPMQQALAGRAGMLPVLTSGSFQNFPGNTENALYSGMIQALAGALERMHSLLSRYPDDPGSAAVIISGGGAALLAPHISLPHRIIDNLVLEGLVIIARVLKHPAATGGNVTT